MSVFQVQEEYTTWIGQPAYSTKLLEKQKMSDSKPVGTHANPGSHLLKATEEEESLHGATTLSVSCGEYNVSIS